MLACSSIWSCTQNRHLLPRWRSEHRYLQSTYDCIERNIYLFSGLCVIEFFEELHFHGVADLIVLVREEVKEGGEDAFAKENDQQVEGKNKGGKSSEVEEEQGEKSDFEIHVWNLKLLAEQNLTL